MTEWKDISTAPKDGTEIFVYDKELGVMTAMYEHQASPPFWSNDVFDYCRDGEGRYIISPTKWQPLPKPPESE